MTPGTCKDCKFFDFMDADTGLCRRHAPGIVLSDEQDPWPTVKMGDWCGEFEVDTSKLPPPPTFKETE